jgi:hypothetical protein
VVLDDEIARLQVVDPVVAAQHARGVEVEAQRRGAFGRAHCLGRAAEEARAIGARPARFLDQAELRHMPIETRERLQRAPARRHLAEAPVAFEEAREIGVEAREIGVREQRHMAEEVVEDVGLSQ